jgi:hypothetical protein
MFDDSRIADWQSCAWNLVGSILGESMIQSFRYKNISPLPQTLIGFGLFQPGEEFETETEVVNLQL